jgi:hypothetical protein
MAAQWHAQAGAEGTSQDGLGNAFTGSTPRTRGLHDAQALRYYARRCRSRSLAAWIEISLLSFAMDTSRLRWLEWAGTGRNSLYEKNPHFWAPARRKIGHLSPRQWPLLFETVCALLIASIGLKLTRLQSLHRAGHRIFRRFAGDRSVALNEPQHIAETVNRMTNLVPGVKCLSRALAIQWMLARRGMVSTVHVGVAKSVGRPFQSHAWITLHGTVLVGETTASNFYREMFCLNAETYLPIRRR